jgi:hypothetical protein
MVSEAGLYKIKFMGGYHLLRVSVQGGKKVFKIDHGLYEPMERLHKTEEYLEVICRVNENTISKDDIFHAKITISWEDRERRGFSMTMRDLWTLRTILHELPFLQGPLNYTPGKK